MLTKFTVKRSEWGRGQHNGGRLLDTKDKKCCLGFFCEQSGIPSKNIRNIGYPDEITDVIGQQSKIPALCDLSKVTTNWPGSNRTTLSRDAASINDNSNLSDEDRELRLIALFKTHGIELTFED